MEPQPTKQPTVLEGLGTLFLSLFVTPLFLVAFTLIPAYIAYLWWGWFAVQLFGLPALPFSVIFLALLAKDMVFDLNHLKSELLNTMWTVYPSRWVGYLSLGFVLHLLLH